MKKKKKEKTENMATLDDKLMGEKLHYYCSSSEDEDEPEPPPQGADGQPLQRPTPGKYLIGSIDQADPSCFYIRIS